MTDLSLTTGGRVVRSADGQARLHLTVTGDGPPLLLIHGWALDQRIFAPQLPALASDFTVIAWDRRGFGRSTGVPDLDADLADIEHILDTLALGAVHVLGMSQGGRLALRFAITHPERVRSLLLQAPAVDGFRPSSRDREIPLDEYAALVRLGRIDEMRSAWLDHPMMSAGIHDPAIRRSLEAILADYRGIDLVAEETGQSTHSFTVVDRLDRLGMPLLVLTGLMETPARREHAQFLVSRLPQAHEVLFRHSGHLCNVTEPERFNRVVLEFCRSVDGRTSGGGAED